MLYPYAMDIEAGSLLRAVLDLKYAAKSYADDPSAKNLDSLASAAVLYGAAFEKYKSEREA